MLGPVELVGDDGPVALPAKHRRLLAALVVSDGRPCGVDELVDAVWGEAPPASARKLLQVYVSQLRKVLPEGISVATQANAYALHLTKDGLDARRFERLAGESSEAARDGNAALAVSLAEQALALWRGRAFGSSPTRRSREARRSGSTSFASRHSRSGSTPNSHSAKTLLLAEILSLAAEHPLRERIHRQAMLALYRCGRQADALEHYTAVRRRFRDELGLEPGTALRALQQRILRQDPELEPPAITAAAGSALPAAPNPLVGRARELESLRRLLERREARLLVLTGAGGSGKTRLALEAARTAAPSYANGVVLVELAPLRDPELVVPTIAHALEIGDVDDEAPLETLAKAVAARELLLVLDNAEHLRGAATAFSALLARAPRLALLVTSRAVLHVSGEHVFPVDPLGTSDAVELFVQRAQLLKPSFERTDENERDLQEICRRVDGLPLAIELAAARIRTLTPRTLRERLDDRLALLTGGPVTCPRVSRRCARRSTGASSCSRRLSDGLSPGSRSFRPARHWPRPRPCATPTSTLSKRSWTAVWFGASKSTQSHVSDAREVREYAYELLGADRPDAERGLLDTSARSPSRPI